LHLFLLDTIANLLVHYSISFRLLYKGIFLINATINPFSLDLGPNNFEIFGYFIRPPDAEGQKAMREFLSTFAVGAANNLTLRGDPDACRVEDFKLMLTEFESPIELPGLPNKLMQRAELELTWLDYLGLFTGKTKEIRTKAWLYNPFALRVYVTETNLQAVLSDTLAEIGYFQANLTANPIILEANSVTVTTDLSITIYHMWDRAMLTAFWDALTRGEVMVNVFGTLDMSLDHFQTGLDYYQNDIPVTLSKP